MNNPFKLISSEPAEYNSMLIKSNLLMILVSHIRDNGWTQSKAAEVLGVSQPRISNLMNGMTNKFSIDMLMEMLFKMGFSVEMRFNPNDKISPLDINIVSQEEIRSRRKEKGATPLSAAP